MTSEEMAAQQMNRPASLERLEITLRRVLVPLDGSPLAESVLPYVARIARPLDLEVALLRVVPAIPPRVVEATRNIVVDNTERLTEEANSYLRTVGQSLSSSGLRTLTAVRVGEAAPEILAAARECEAQMIAMTTHGRGMLGRLFFGSVAEAVLHRAHVPVFLLRAAEAERGKQAA